METAYSSEDAVTYLQAEQRPIPENKKKKSFFIYAIEIP
jgi:hypothetical protein